MILVIGLIRTSRQSFSKLVGNGSRSFEVLFDFMIDFMISVFVAKVKVFIKKFSRARDPRFGVHYRLEK